MDARARQGQIALDEERTGRVGENSELAGHESGCSIL
jgi:hypothetical protein